MAELPITICRIDTPEGEQDVITCLPHEHIQRHGLAKEAVIGRLLRPFDPKNPAITPDVFARNATFVEFMHALIARCGPELPSLLAQGRKESEWLYLIDKRAATADGRVPKQDVFGAFRLREGRIVAGSYQRNLEHRILSERGFFQLPRDLAQRLTHELAALRPEERKVDEVDPIDEAQVYVAYGRYPQAEEILQEALRKQPMRDDVRAKLQEVQAQARDSADEVDPVAEAEIYATYGRYAQAEEILSEALAKHAGRPDLRDKLLEIQAKRRRAESQFRITLGTRKEWAFAAAVVTTVVTAMAAPHHTSILALLIALPWTVLWLCKKYPAAFGDLRDGAAAQIAWLFLPGVGLFLSAHVAPGIGVIDYVALTQVIPHAALLAIATVTIGTRFEPSIRESFASLLVVGALALPYAAGLALTVNLRFDGEPQTHRVTVESKRESHQRSRKYYAAISPWGGTDIRSLLISEHLYKTTPKGGELCIRSYSGALGIAWYTYGACS